MLAFEVQTEYTITNALLLLFALLRHHSWALKQNTNPFSRNYLPQAQRTPFGQSQVGSFCADHISNDKSLGSAGELGISDPPGRGLRAEASWAVMAMEFSKNVGLSIKHGGFVCFKPHEMAIADICRYHMGASNTNDLQGPVKVNTQCLNWCRTLQLGHWWNNVLVENCSHIYSVTSLSSDMSTCQCKRANDSPGCFFRLILGEKSWHCKTLKASLLGTILKLTSGHHGSVDTTVGICAWRWSENTLPTNVKWQKPGS